MFQDDDVDGDGSLVAAPRGVLGGGASPKKKKRPHHTFKLFGKGGSGGLGGGAENSENFAPSVFQMSQLDASQGFSQGGFSQQYSQSSQSQFGNYFGQMTVHDGGAGMDDHSYSGDGFQLAGAQLASTAVASGPTAATSSSAATAAASSTTAAAASASANATTTASSSSAAAASAAAAASVSFNSSFQLPFPPSRDARLSGGGRSGGPLDAMLAGGSGGSSSVTGSGSSSSSGGGGGGGGGGVGSAACAERERQIALPSVTQNPFLPHSGYNGSSSSGNGGSSTSSSNNSSNNNNNINNNISNSNKPPQHLWISAFRPWPRYLWDFEPHCLLGEGVQSLVYCARKRVDGCWYAVKRLKRQIQSEKEGLLLTREAMALAAFAGCPNLLRYYSSWIDDGHLHIQTELCQLGSLDTLVGAACFGDAQLGARGGGGGSSSGGGGDAFMMAHRAGAGAGAGAGVTETQAAAADQQYGGMTLSQLPLSQIDINPLSQIDVGCGPALLGPGEGEGVPEPLVWLVMARVAQALAFLHARGVAHLDVRPANIFVSVEGGAAAAAAAIAEGGGMQDGGPEAQREATRAALNALLQAAPFHAAPDASLLVHSLLHGLAALKLGDLGQCCSVGSGDFIEGESRYCPREVINGDFKAIDLCKADVFSLAASCYELCLGRQLGAGAEGALEWHSLRDGALSPGVVQHYSAELVEAFRFMLHPAPEERPTAQQVVHAAEARVLRTLNAGTLSEEQQELQRLQQENAQLRAMLGGGGI